MSKVVRRLMSIATLMVSSIAGAQLVDAMTPVNSPIWWTLTDSLSPAGLQAEFEKRESSIARYRHAVDAGLEQDLPEEKLSELRFYLNPALTPDLVPMWWAFDHLAQWWLPQDGSDQTRSALTQFSLSGAAVDAVLRSCEMHVARVKERENVFAPLQSEFVRMQWEISKKLGDTRSSQLEIAAHLSTGDADWFARMSGKDVAEVSILLKAGKSNFVADAAAESLVELRSQIVAEDWQRLRAFLHHRAAERVGVFRDF